MVQLIKRIVYERKIVCHFSITVKGTVAREKLLKLRPWGDELDPDY